MDTDVAIFTGFDEEAPVTGLPEGDDCFPAIGAMFQRMTNPAQQRAVINLDGEASVMAVSAGGDPQSEDLKRLKSWLWAVTMPVIVPEAL